MTEVGVACVCPSAFLLGYLVFRSQGHCAHEEDRGEDEGAVVGGAKPAVKGGAGLYLGELRVMMRKLLQDEDIYNTVR